MPIRRRLFELGVGEETEGLMLSIYRFLATHNSTAYTSNEIAAELGIEKPLLPKFLRALAVLRDLGGVEEGLVLFYALGVDLDTATWQPVRATVPPSAAAATIEV